DVCSSDLCTRALTAERQGSSRCDCRGTEEIPATRHKTSRRHSSWWLVAGGWWLVVRGWWLVVRPATSQPASCGFVEPAGQNVKREPRDQSTSHQPLTTNH